MPLRTVHPSTSQREIFWLESLVDWRTDFWARTILFMDEFGRRAIVIVLMWTKVGVSSPFAQALIKAHTKYQFQVYPRSFSVIYRYLK